MPEFPRPAGLSRRNFTLGVINGVLFFAFNAFIDVDTVLPGFAWQITGQALWIGVLVSLINSGWFWPQLFLSPILATRPHLRPWYWLSAVMRCVPLSAAAVMAWNVHGLSPLATFVLIALCYGLYTVGGGVSILPFITIVAESVPANWRGRFFGIRYLVGGLLAFGIGFVVKWVLSDNSGYEFPRNYALLFTLGALIAVPSMFSFCLVREPVRVIESRQFTWWWQFQRGWRLARRDPNFRRLLITRSLWSLATGLTIPFIVPYAFSQLQVATAVLGFFMASKSLTYSLSNLLWFRVSDQQGNRRLLVLSSLVSLLALVLLLGVRYLPAGEVVRVAGLSLSAKAAMVCLIFAFVGFASSGQEIGYTNFLLEITEERKRSVYLGFFYVVLTPLCWVPVLGAVLVGQNGNFLLGFHLSAVLLAVMIFYTFRLREVRDLDLPDEKDA
jgi:MFS family permease